MNISQASSYLGVHEKTLRRWVKTGKLPAKLATGPQGEQYTFLLGDLQRAKEGTTLPEVVSSLDKSEPVIVQGGQNRAHPCPPGEVAGLITAGQTGFDVLRGLVDLIRGQGTVKTATKLDDLPELLTLSEAAGYLRVGKGTVRQAIKEGLLRAVKLGRGHRIKRGDLVAYIETL